MVVERGIAARRKLAEMESRLRKADDRNVAQGDSGAVLEVGADAGATVLFSTFLFLLYRFLPNFTDFSDFLVSVLPSVLFTS